jgi:hypothetical protein
LASKPASRRKEAGFVWWKAVDFDRITTPGKLAAPAVPFRVAATAANAARQISARFYGSYLPRFRSLDRASINSVLPGIR